MKKFLAKRASYLLIPALLGIGISLGLSLVSCETSYGQVYTTYAPPEWAPPYDNVSTIRYYYLPDYDMYYDVWERQYYYFDGSQWIATYDLPPMWAGASLSSAFVVLIDRGVDRPWLNHDYYVRNYPHHGHEQYRDIVIKNRIITNLRPDHELVPRAYNENNKRVTFMQRPIQQDTRRAGSTDPNRGGNPVENRPPGQAGAAPAAPNPALDHSQRPSGNAAYHQQVHEVPMKSIAPSMPPESRKLNYGGGQNKAPRSAPPPAPGRQQNNQPNKGPAEKNKR